MIKPTAYFALFALLAAGINAHPSTEHSNYDFDFEFHKWTREFERDYVDTLDWLTHRNIFHDNLQLIKDHNLNLSHSYKLGLNQFADMSFSEWQQNYFGYDTSLRRQEQDAKLKYNTVFVLNSTSVPDSMDWRTKGAVTPVKNQGQCGSCWSFSATGSMEGAHFLKSGKLVSLSEQQLVDCSTSEGNHGCFGGLMDFAFQYVEENHGIDSEKDYPYDARSGSCNKAKAQKDVANFTSFVDVAQNDEDALKTAVAQQPVSVAIEADQPAFQFYKSGIFNTQCGTTLDHGVLAAGYGTDNGMDYWLVKNSWAETWGDKGYIKLARNIKAKEGQCGIAMQPSYPVAA